nr:probable serine/threonine-protein kinase cdc7 [Onthophagus taurus]
MTNDNIPTIKKTNDNIPTNLHNKPSTRVPINVSVVRSQLQGKCYDDWDDLKEILCTVHQDKKHYIQLIEELNTLKQRNSESVASFHERIDKLTSRLLGSVSYKNLKEQIGKFETIKELAMNRFIHHSKPDISRFLRGQNLDDISEALLRALEEERAINISHSEFRPKSSNKYCSFCKKNNHNTKACFRKPKSLNQPINFNSSNPSNSNSSNFSNSNYNSNQKLNKTNANPNPNAKFCNYCKKNGHTISECRKREYNNKRKQQNNNSNHNNSAQVHLNSNPSHVNASLVEQDIQMV